MFLCFACRKNVLSAWYFRNILIRNCSICRLAIINELIDEACYASPLETHETAELLLLSCYGVKRKVWQIRNINFWTRFLARRDEIWKKEEKKEGGRKEKGKKGEKNERKDEGERRGKKRGRGRRMERRERREKYGAEPNGSVCLDRNVATVWPSYALLPLLYSFFKSHSFLAEFSRSLSLKS